MPTKQRAPPQPRIKEQRSKRDQALQQGMQNLRRKIGNWIVRTNGGVANRH